MIWSLDIVLISSAEIAQNDSKTAQAGRGGDRHLAVGPRRAWKGCAPWIPIAVCAPD